MTLLVIAAAFWLMARGAPLPLWCWTLAFMIWLMPMLSPPLLFPVARIAPLFPVLLIVLLLRPPPSASSRAAMVCGKSAEGRSVHFDPTAAPIR